LYGPGVNDQYAAALSSIRHELVDQGDAALSIDTDEFADYATSHHAMRPFVLLEEDASYSTRRVQHAMLGRHTRGEVELIRIEIPVEPHHLNAQLRTLRATTWRPYNTWNWTYDSNSHSFTLEIEADDQAVNQELEDLRWRVGRLNAEVDAENQTFRARIVDLVEARKQELRRSAERVSTVVKNIGLPLARKHDERTEVVDLRIRRPIEVLREKPKATSARDDYALKAETVIEVLDQVWGFMSIWERTPQTYSKMGEEELRDNIVAMLNTLFDSGPTGATGETFSKKGKTVEWWWRIRRGSGSAVWLCHLETNIWSFARIRWE
jgi:hypothetical protein